MTVSRPYHNLKTNKNRLNPSYDAIVIGSGMGGLVTALELARNGFEVAVFERHYLPGGYAHQFKRQGFTFDVSLHHMGALEPGEPIHGVLHSLGVYQKLNLKKSTLPFRAEFPDYAITLPNGGLPLEQKLMAEFPEEKAPLKQLLDHLKQMKHHAMDRWVTPDFNVAPEDYLPARYRNHTFDQLLDSFLSNPKLKAVLSQYWMYLGLPPSRANAVYSGCVITSQYLNGNWDIQGGGASLSTAMVDRLNELGGICFTQAPVQAITVENGAATGVTLADGRSIQAALVVSNADPFHTFNDLVPAHTLKPVFKHRINLMEPSLSAFCLYLGLDCPPSQLGIPPGILFHNHSFNLDEAYQRCLNAHYHQTDWCLTSYEKSAICATPAGGGALSFAELAIPDDWFTLNDADYAKKKAAILKVLLTKYETRFPGLRSHITVQELGTPRTMKRFSGNHKGAIYGLAQTLGQGGPSRLSNTTPLKQLFLTGAWTRSGGGYEGAIMTGVQTADVILKWHPAPKPAPPLAMTPPDSTPCLAVPCGEKLSRIYPGDISMGNRADLTTYLKHMDRARVDVGEAIFKVNAEESLFKHHNVQVYTIQVNMLSPATVGDTLLTKTQSYRKGAFSGLCTQDIFNATTHTQSVAARIEIVTLDQNGELGQFPDTIPEWPEQPPLFNLSDLLPPLRTRDYFGFEQTIKVYTEDTDLLGITFHAAYVRFVEETLYEFLDAQPATTTRKRHWVFNTFFIRFFHSCTAGSVLTIKMGSRPGPDGTLIGNQKLLSGGRIIAEVHFEVALTED